MPEHLECEVLQKERYINPLTYLPSFFTGVVVVRCKNASVAR